MTTSFSGADIAELHDLAKRYAGAAQYLVDVTARVTLGLGALTWQGADAEKSRESWRGEGMPVLHRVAGELREAGLKLVHEAEEQAAASEAGGAGAGGTAAPAPAPASSEGASGEAASGGADSGKSTTGKSATSGTDWSERLGEIRTALINLPSVAMLARVERQFSGFLTTSNRKLAEAVYQTVLEEASTFEKVGLRTLGAVGTAFDLHAFAESARQGDLDGMVGSGGSLGITALGAAGALGAAATATAGASWAGGYWVGGKIYDGMQGTRYGDIVQDMTDDAFDQWGAAGMLKVPGILGAAALVCFTEDPPPPSQ